MNMTMYFQRLFPPGTEKRLDDAILLYLFNQTMLDHDCPIVEIAAITLSTLMVAWPYG